MSGVRNLTVLPSGNCFSITSEATTLTKLWMQGSSGSVVSKLATAVSPLTFKCKVMVSARPGELGLTNSHAVTSAMPIGDFVDFSFRHPSWQPPCHEAYGKEASPAHRVSARV
jgi:hypothetical protein